MNYNVELSYRGRARDITEPREDLTYITDDFEIERVWDDVGLTEVEDLPTALWVEVADGEYGDIFCTFTNAYYSIYADVFEVVREWTQ